MIAGGVILCKDKSELDIESAKAFFKKRLKKDHSRLGREWAYKNVPRKIICEEYIENLADNNYKFFAFDGVVKAVYVAPYREKTVDYFDEQYKHLDIRTKIHGCAPNEPPKPASFEKMKELAERLSKGYPHIRVDLYDVNGKIYFGEMTFYHEAGFIEFIPDKWNREFGNWIDLSKALKSK